MSVPTNRVPSVVRRLGSVVFAVGLSTATLTGLGAASASAATVCNPGGDICVIEPDTVQTPLGLVTVTVSATNVVTVHLDPSTLNTVVIGLPFTLHAGLLVSACPGGCSRTTIDTTGGLVTIDTVQVPPGSAARAFWPNLAIIEIHPPGPCRAMTIGTTVTFTPLTPPGPPT